MSKISLNNQEKKPIVIASVTSNTKETVQLTVRSACTDSEDITITVGAEVDTIAVLDTDDTATKVAIKIAAAFAASLLWDITRSGAVVTFTRKLTGAVSDMVFDGGTTGVTADIEVTTQGNIQTIEANTTTYMNFPLITEDNYGSVTAETPVSDWNFVVPKRGVYDIYAQIATVAHTLVSAIKYELNVYVNGVKAAVINKFQSESTTAGFEVFLKGDTALRLAKGDIVKIGFYTNSAAAINASTDSLLGKVVIIKRETKIEET